MIFWQKIMHVLHVERSRSLSCTHIVTQDFKLIGLYRPTAAVVSKLLQIKCINATSYDLHVNPHTVRHLVAPARQIGLWGDFWRFWLANSNSSLRERVDFLGHLTREWISLGIASDQLNVFLFLFVYFLFFVCFVLFCFFHALFELKTHSIRVK